MPQEREYPEPIDTDLTPSELARELFNAPPPKDWDKFAEQADAESDSTELNSA